jgi:transposase-like protein
MACPECKSTHIRKDGNHRGKYNPICVDFHCQFMDDYGPLSPYSDEVKLCRLKKVLAADFNREAITAL